MMKSFLCASLMALMVSGLLFSNVYFGMVQASADVTGIISSDTTWTKANSPYSLTGPMLVSEGVNLTIEPGVTVNFNEYYIRVNGTLSAIGISTDPIYFNGGYIKFTESSNDWNEQTTQGSVIENTVSSTAINIEEASPKIDNNVFDGCEIKIIDGGSPIISHNTLTGGGISVEGGSISSGFPVISNNRINGGDVGIGCNGYASISDNSISGCTSGIQLYSKQVFSGSSHAYPIVERNLITHNTRGINIALASRFDAGTVTPTILNNTISNNSVGIYLYQSNFDTSPTITYNNIHDNSDYNIQLAEYTENDVNATYNWWGTTDTQAINQTIFDFKNDFNLGTVNFIPFLSEPNPEEMSTPIPEFPSWIILPLLLTVTLLIILCKRRLVKTTNN
jgi:parallel beta-helix repeat protein